MVSDSAAVVFDDERAIANAGVMLPAALAEKLGIEELVDRSVDLDDRPGAANPGPKVMTMLSAMALGTDCIEDCALLRSGQTAAVLPHRIAALAHNLLRWVNLIGLPGRTIRAARTLRRRLLALPGRLTRTARRWTLHLPARWPWRDAFVEALARTRALPAAA